MKLLFDENLSPKLPLLIKDRFLGSLHIRDCGLKGASDLAVWEYAQKHGFTLVSKDSDFYQRSLLLGAPPKLVWLRLGNCNRQQLVDLLVRHEKDIETLASATETVLVIP
jgi:predicted nuclease of predicted toxin-antitoxin system